MSPSPWQTTQSRYSDDESEVPPMVPPKERSISNVQLSGPQNTASVLDGPQFNSYNLDGQDYQSQNYFPGNPQYYDNYSNTSMTRDQPNNQYRNNYDGISETRSPYGDSFNAESSYEAHRNAPVLPPAVPLMTQAEYAAPRQSAAPPREKLKTWAARPWIVYFLTLVQIAVFIAELAKMGVLTRSPIQTKPSFNPMIGPSSYVLINMGARFTPCMHAISNITDVDNINFPCPNSTDANTNVCSLSELCGMGGLPPPQNSQGLEPHQWWRFITPIFLHAGFIHIGFNMLLQLKLGGELEQSIGHVRFFIIYFAAGIGGFIFGGNFTPDGIASTGASGSLFGIIALDLLDLLFNWKLYQNPKRALLMHIVEIIISFGIGLLPGLDNFSHIGGFCIGVLLGTALLRSPLPIRQRTGSSGSRDMRRSPSPDLFPNFSPSQNGGNKNAYMASATPARYDRPNKAMKINWLNPKKHFTNRPALWYAWGIVRIVAVGLVLTFYIVLIKEFENGGGNCSWCKYLSCLPVNGWCDIGNIRTSFSSSSNSSSAYMLYLFIFFAHAKRQLKHVI